MSLRRFPVVFLLLLLSAGVATAQGTGEDLVRQVHARYGGEWIRSVSFVQKTTFADGRIETWYESLALPGRLRVDIAPISNGRAMLVRNDSSYAWAGGVLQPGQARVQPLLLALYDIHAQAPEQSIRQLRAINVDLARTHRATWQGDDVVVLGAVAGDTLTNQVWFHATRMVAVRMLIGPANARQDIRFGGYVQVGRFWQEREVEIYRGATRSLREEYFDVKTDAPLDEAIFLPTSPYRAPAWVGEGATRW